jgi:hypothetical protein
MVKDVSEQLIGLIFKSQIVRERSNPHEHLDAWRRNRYSIPKPWSHTNTRSAAAQGSEDLGYTAAEALNLVKCKQVHCIACRDHARCSFLWIIIVLVSNML